MLKQAGLSEVHPDYLLLDNLRFSMNLSESQPNNGLNSFYYFFLNTACLSNSRKNKHGEEFADPKSFLPSEL